MRVRKKDRRRYPKRGVRVETDPADPFGDGDDRERQLRSAYLFGACLARPGGDPWHGPGTCELCDWIRGKDDDPELMVSLERGRFEQERWLRMYRHRRAYGGRRRRR